MLRKNMVCLVVQNASGAKSFEFILIDLGGGKHF
jgi:hypothetical protein